ncbi:MAG: class A beta-lactamase [Hyphomicrobiaceae bacterium]
MLTRRQFTAIAAGLMPALLPALSRPARAEPLSGLPARFAALETAVGARLGVGVLDTATGRETGHRADERFPLCSTFKLLLAGAVLARVDAGREQLDRRIRYAATDLVTYSPVTQHHSGEGLTVAELCRAAVTISDNTAANLLLASLGGPQGLTAFLRTTGDGVTRLDRIETALNEARPGDARDTTTPAAMARTMRALLLGDALSAAGRAQLAAWLAANTTGDARLRAGFPRGWRVGDKTGSGGEGTANDVAIAWPPGRAPVIVTVYLTQSAATADARNAAIADVAKAVAAAL